MRTLEDNISAEISQPQTAWTEVFDIYLRQSITTPWGSVDTLRLTNYSGDFTFPTPSAAPEPSDTRGDEVTYHAWPIKRDRIASATRTSGEKLAVVASNVTGEWAEMLAGVEWRDCFIVIRKVVFSVESRAWVTDAGEKVVTPKPETVVYA